MTRAPTPEIRSASGGDRPSAVNSAAIARRTSTIPGVRKERADGYKLGRCGSHAQFLDNFRTGKIDLVLDKLGEFGRSNLRTAAQLSAHHGLPSRQPPVSKTQITRSAASIRRSANMPIELCRGPGIPIGLR